MSKTYSKEDAVCIIPKYKYRDNIFPDDIKYIHSVETRSGYDWSVIFEYDGTITKLGYIIQIARGNIKVIPPKRKKGETEYMHLALCVLFFSNREFVERFQQL